MGPEQREVKLIDMEMHDIKLGGHPPHFVEHEHVVWNGIAHGRIKSERLLAPCNESCRGDGIAAGEQCHVMPLADKLLGEVEDDPLGPAVKAWRNAFHQGCYLRNLHRTLSANQRAGLQLGVVGRFSASTCDHTPLLSPGCGR
jgi:hypothetical protein